MAIDRDPVFELHIEPMFRLLDRVHMLKLSPERRVDLADYQQVRDKYAKILTMLQSAGTPMSLSWPAERSLSSAITRAGKLLSGL